MGLIRLKLVLIHYDWLAMKIDDSGKTGFRYLLDKSRCLASPSISIATGLRSIRIVELKFLTLEYTDRKGNILSANRMNTLLIKTKVSARATVQDCSRQSA